MCQERHGVPGARRAEDLWHQPEVFFLPESSGSRASLQRSLVVEENIKTIDRREDKWSRVGERMQRQWGRRESFV